MSCWHIKYSSILIIYQVLIVIDLPCVPASVKGNMIHCLSPQKVCLRMVSPALVCSRRKLEQFAKAFKANREI